jgi:hypothetical protein
MNIAILTFQGFNELDSFIALGVLNRIRKPGWRVTLCCPEPEVTSMNGVTVRLSPRWRTRDWPMQSSSAAEYGHGRSSLPRN